MPDTRGTTHEKVSGQRSVVSSQWSLILVVAAAALLLVSLRLPLWQIRFEAPQYRGPEALHISVHPNSMRGDLRELTTLDQYIGVHIPATLPQFKWLPTLLILGAGLGVGAAFLRGSARSWMLTIVCGLLAAGLSVAALQARAQIRDIGHKRDAKVILAGVRDFTPPFLGTAKIAQFEVSSRFGLGAWLIGSALAMQLAAAWMGRCAALRAAAVAPALLRSNSSTAFSASEVLRLGEPRSDTAPTLPAPRPASP